MMMREELMMIMAMSIAMPMMVMIAQGIRLGWPLNDDGDDAEGEQDEER